MQKEITYHILFSDGEIRGAFGYKPSKKQAQKFVEKYFALYYLPDNTWQLVKGIHIDGEVTYKKLSVKGKVCKK